MIKNNRTAKFFTIFVFLNLVFGCSVSPTVDRDITERSVMLAWDPPRTNVDGTVLNNLAGYRIYHGKTSGLYPNKIDVDDQYATKHTIYKLSPGTYYFAITAYNRSGIESEHSSEASTTIK